MTIVYESMRVRRSDVPFLGRHIARFATNCIATGLTVPDRLPEFIFAARRADAAGDYAMRVEWDGSDLRISSREIQVHEPIVIATTSVPHPGYRVKTMDRDPFDRARQEVRGRGAEEGLMLTENGYVAEGTLFAIGWFDRDRLRVPTLDLGILPSIGRARVIEVARALGIEVEEGAFPRSALDGRPIFITTAVRGVVPVATLDGVEIPEDDRIRLLEEAFWPEEER